MKSNSMTKAERAELGRLVRDRARVAKDDIESHAARVMANVEAQLAARYPENYPAWADVTVTRQASYRQGGHPDRAALPRAWHPGSLPPEY